MEVKIKTPEYLSGDIFEEDFLRTFSFVHRLQYLLGSCRTDIKNRFAMPTTASQRCYTIFCLILTGLSNCALCHNYIREKKHPILCYLSLSSILIQFVTFVSNMIHIRFVNRDKHVEFLVKMQKIDRLLKVDQWTVLNEWVKQLTNGPIAFSLVVFLILSILAFVEEGFRVLLMLGAAYSSLVLLLDIIACSTIITYFVLRMRFINCLMENHLDTEENSKPSRRFLSRTYMKYYAQKTQNYYETSDVHIYLGEIFKCYKMYQDLYMFQLLTFCLQSVGESLVTFEVLLYSIQIGESTVLEMASVAVFVALDVCVAIFLSLRFELILYEVKKMKRSCINIMARHVEGPLREKARKMLKMIDETPPRFRVYEMWEMNASTFVTMVSLITSLVVTLLQFAFL